MSKHKIPSDELGKDNLSKTHCEKYDCKLQEQIQAVYIIASLLWVVLIFVLGLWKDGKLICPICDQYF